MLIRPILIQMPVEPQESFILLTVTCWREFMRRELRFRILRCFIAGWELSVK